MVKMSMTSSSNVKNEKEHNVVKQLPKRYQLSLIENILLHGIIDLIKRYTNDLETNQDIFEDERFWLEGMIDDLRKLLENVEGLYTKENDTK